MRRLLGGAVVIGIIGASAGAQSPAVLGASAGAESTPPRLTLDGLAPSHIVQPSYGSASRWFSTANRSADGFPAPAIPVVLTAAERSFVNSGGEEYSVQPCAGEPFFVYQPSIPVPYWAIRSLFGPDAGMWPPSRLDGIPTSYYASSAEYRSSSITRSYVSRSYTAYRPLPSYYSPAYTTYTAYSSWYPWSTYSGGWYSSDGWYRSSGWAEYRESTSWTYSVSTYRSSFGWFGYPWGSIGYWPYRRPRLQPVPTNGHWELPDGPCYTRDQRGQVMVIQ